MSPEPTALPPIPTPALVVEPPPRRRLGGLVAATVLVLAAAAGTWAWGSGGSFKRLFGEETKPIPLVEVDQGSLAVYLVETGALESANNTSIKCQVESLLGTTGGTAGTGRTGSTGSATTQGGAGGASTGGTQAGGSSGGSTASAAGATKKAGASTAKKGSTATANSKTATSTASKSSAGGGAAASKSSASGSSSSSSASTSASASSGTTSANQRPTIKSFSYDVQKHTPLRGATTTKPTQAKTNTATGMGGMGGGGGGGGRGGRGGRGGGGGGGGGMGGMEEKAGSTRIIWLKPEGSEIKKGETICELDSAAFRDELAAQKIRWFQAKSWVEQAKEIYELNDLIYREYHQGIYPQDLQAIRQYIQSCETDHDRATKTEAWSREVYEKRYRAQAQYEADRDTVEQTALALREAHGMLERLVKYTGPRLDKAMRSKLQAIKSDWLAQDYSFQLEDDRLRRIQKMIDNCTIKAPADGVLVYANQSNAWSGQVEVQIQEGATVREGQTLFDLPDPKRMRVKVKINESKMASVQPGQRAEVLVEAFPDRSLKGTVAEITPIPSIQNRFSDIKIYFAIVNIDAGFEGLRPGMTTEVAFLTGSAAKVTRVPVRSLRWAAGRTFVAVAARVDGETKWDWRPVTIGLMDTQYAEVKSGLEPGEKVVADPAALLPGPDPDRLAPPTQTASAPAPSSRGG